MGLSGGDSTCKYQNAIAPTQLFVVVGDRYVNDVYPERVKVAYLAVLDNHT
jgi:hypothetical protein